MRATNPSSDACSSRATLALRSEGGAGGASGLGQRVARLGSARLAGRSDELAQHLRGGLGPGLFELADRGGERAAEWRWQREARQPMLQQLEPATMGPMAGGGSRSRSCATRTVSQRAKIPSRRGPRAVRGRAPNSAVAAGSQPLTRESG